jgi:ubiquinone/menaquinone biosynthesis C-methylase UbiE
MDTPRAVWEAGDYKSVAEFITSAAEDLVEHADVQPGMEVLDVACGTGNAAIPAAKLGARVIGLDIVPALLDSARERAADAMVEVEWVEGDASSMPFDDGRFDRVLSIFGHMFVPDHAAMAAELKRVCKPGGTIAICCWSPTGALGDMFTSMSADPPPPEPPNLWGTEEHVRELLGDAEFHRGRVEWRHDSIDEYAAFMEESFGPLIAARETSGEEWPDLQRRYRDVLARWNQADDGTLRYEGEYLIAVVRP